MVKADKILNYWVYNGTYWSMYTINLLQCLFAVVTMALTG